MQLAETLRILEALADGRHPDTGDPLPSENVYQSPQVARALYIAVQELKGSVRTNGQGSGARDNAGKPWSAEEEAELLREFAGGSSLPQMGKKHGRTVAAIHGRLYLLGKLPAYRPRSGG
jgi:hypothetical protein